MERSEIEQRVLAILHDQKGVTSDSISPTTPMTEAGIDSLDALSILFEVEEAFGISIPDDRARAIRTYDDIVTAVESSLPN